MIDELILINLALQIKSLSHLIQKQLLSYCSNVIIKRPKRHFNKDNDLFVIV